jgi:hypothetical protein
MSDSKTMKRTCEPKTEQAARRWRNIHNKKAHKLLRYLNKQR